MSKQIYDYDYIIYPDARVYCCLGICKTYKGFIWKFKV